MSGSVEAIEQGCKALGGDGWACWVLTRTPLMNVSSSTASLDCPAPILSCQGAGQESREEAFAGRGVRTRGSVNKLWITTLKTILACWGQHSSEMESLLCHGAILPQRRTPVL